MVNKVQKTDQEWQQQLTPEQFKVARKKGTERAFTGEYHDNKQPGIYRCVCCGAELFSSDTKYDSGTGWPSFWAPLKEENIGYEAIALYLCVELKSSAPSVMPTSVTSLMMDLRQPGNVTVSIQLL